MAIVPDDKDWTWVLSRPCDDCGFDASTAADAGVAAQVRANGAAWAEVLAGPSDRLVERPDAATWSTLEYACHVRDVYHVYHGRIQRMLVEDDPWYPNWDQDLTAVEERYNDQSPATVAGELVEAAETVAGRLDGVAGDEWSRPGRRSDGSTFSVGTLARYMVHDPIHHLWDVRRPR